MKEFHRDFANRTGLAQAWTVKSADRLFTIVSLKFWAGLQCVNDLSSWAAQMSLEFGNKIVQALRWTANQVDFNDPFKRNCSMRLLAVLQSTLIAHPRSANLINAFMEGVDLQLLTTEGWGGN